MVNTRFIASHIVLHSDDQTPQAGNLICAMIAGNGTIIHVTIVIRGTFVSHIGVQQNLVITGMVS